MPGAPAGPVRVAADLTDRSEWTVEPELCGRFAEHIGGAMYPGVYENYVTNGAFDAWNEGRGPIGGFDVERHDGVAYPWVPAGETGDTEQRRGGVRGREGSPLVDGVDVPAGQRLDPAGVTESRYQHVEGRPAGGVRQRVALPDRRAPGFDVALSVRGDVGDCAVRLDAPDGETLASERVPVDEEWSRHAVSLAPGESPERHAAERYGVLDLAVVAEGGALDVDWVTLIPADAVEGQFNPWTVERLREENVTSLRWPGGNYASQYRWRDGVGPAAERPVTPVANWGGLDQNLLGTNEWLRFCELVDAEPVLVVPVWAPAGPAAAADWVAYCNYPPDTELGALRAEHGYPEPWNVTHWGVGNEVWGSWQVGRTDADDYAERFSDYCAAMRDADPSVELDACAVDPWFTLVHDGTREVDALPVGGGDPPVWNDRLFAVAGEDVERVDVHRYTEGISGHTSEDGAREAWLEAHDETPMGYAEVLVNDPGSWDAMFDDLRETAADHGVEDLRITFGEWGLRARETEADWPTPGRGTLAHATFAARALQALLRNSHDVDLAHWTEFSGYVQPTPWADEATHAGAGLFRDVAGSLRGDASWHLVPTAVDGTPVRERPPTGVSIPGDAVSLVDAVTVATAGADPSARTVVVNGSLTRPAAVTLDGGDRDGPVSLTRWTADDPVERGAVRTERRAATAPLDLELAPGAVALVALDGG